MYFISILFILAILFVGISDYIEIMINTREYKKKYKDRE